MNNILTGISGYFSKSLILGTLLPVVIFFTLAWIVATPLLPSELPFLKPIEALDAQWKLLSFSFAVFVLAGFLYNINNPLIRLYEGYPWADLWIGRRRKDYYRRRFRILEAQWRGMPWVQYELKKLNKTDPRIHQVKEKMDVSGRTLRTDFPGEENLVLPTRLGNAIRSFEYYTKAQYKIESVTLWPRLVAKIDKNYAAVIENSKITFDFMLNCSALSTALAFLLLAAGLLYPMPLTSVRSAVIWGSQVIIFWVLSHLFYRLSINRAKTWGNTVKSAFDLYRWDMLKQLGYGRMPHTVDEERALWQNITQRIVYGDMDQVPPVEYYPMTTFVEAYPDFAKFELSRAFAAPDEISEVVVKLQVKNVNKFDVTKVVVTDTLPEDFQYKWDSASVVNESSQGQTVSVVGINPYRFAVGPLNKEQKLELTYKGLSIRKEVGEVDDGGQGENRLAVDFRWLDADPPDGAAGENKYERK